MLIVSITSTMEGFRDWKTKLSWFQLFDYLALLLIFAYVRCNMYLGRYVTSQSFEIQIPLGDPVLLKSRDYSPNITLLYRAWKNILWDKKTKITLIEISSP